MGVGISWDTNGIHVIDENLNEYEWYIPFGSQTWLAGTYPRHEVL